MNEQNKQPYLDHLSNATDLQTSHSAYRAGFISLALERNRRASPYVNEARQLKILASAAKSPADLLNMIEIRKALVTAAGVSDKAAGHLEEADKSEAIAGLISKFLEPAGESFVEELVYRFLLTKGDTLGGSMRNVGGALAQRKLTRSIISYLNLAGTRYWWLDNKKKWAEGRSSVEDAGIEYSARGIGWDNERGGRVLKFNLTLSLLQDSNVDLCLFAATHDRFQSVDLRDPVNFLALGELKGGVDPAGADEHWKTADSALRRIRVGFGGYAVATFFIGAAIEEKMAREIWTGLEGGVITNAANLTKEDQLLSVTRWLCHF